MQMNRSFLLLASCVLLSFAAAGQSVIYGCKNTGYWGSAYNPGGLIKDDGTSITVGQLKKDALKRCTDIRGTACQLLFVSDKAGWVCFISGEVASGKILFMWSDGKPSALAAETDARAKYKAAGGQRADNIEVNNFT